MHLTFQVERRLLLTNGDQTDISVKKLNRLDDDDGGSGGCAMIVTLKRRMETLDRDTSLTNGRRKHLEAICIETHTHTTLQKTALSFHH